VGEVPIRASVRGQYYLRKWRYQMSKINVKYAGNSSNEDISLHVTGKKFVFGEIPGDPMTDGCTYGYVKNGYTFLSANEARRLGIELIEAAGKKDSIKR